MQTRSKKRNDALASTPPPSDAPPSLPLDGVVACGVLSGVASVVDRASLVASSRAFAEASRGVASLPPSFEFSSMRALGHARMAERHSDIEWRLDALMRTLERVEAGVSKARARAYVDRVDPQFHRGAFFCHYAAVAGNLKLLRWLRELEYEFGPLVTRGAAMGGHLDVLKWAVEHGAEWGPWVFSAARLLGRDDVLEYAVANRCPGWEQEIRARPRRRGGTLSPS